MRTARKALIILLLMIPAWMVVFVLKQPSGGQSHFLLEQSSNSERSTIVSRPGSTPTPFRPLPPGVTLEQYASTVNLPEINESQAPTSDENVIMAEEQFIEGDQQATASPMMDGSSLPTPTVQAVVVGVSDDLSDLNPFAGQSLKSIDFSPSRNRITITIQPPDERVNKGKPIVIRFYPGEKCKFGDKRGCVVEYQPDELSKVLFVSIHSGVGGQGQRLRNAFEGTGLNRAKYKIERVSENLEALSGAKVTIAQGDVEISGLRLMIAARLPGSVMEEYFDFPAQEALATAATFESNLADYVMPGQPQLVIETCGWRMPGEEADAVTKDTAASIYLVVIQ